MFTENFLNAFATLCNCVNGTGLSCCKVKGCTRLVLLLLILASMLTALFYNSHTRKFGERFMIPVGVVFFVAIMVSIVEVSAVV